MKNKISVNKSLELIDKVLNYLNNGYTILLESDIVGLLMHAYLTDSQLDPNLIHIDTRIKQSNTDRQKIDFVIGEIFYSNSSRPRINPSVLFELKAIPEFGFTNNQKDKRFEYVLNDIKKIKDLNLSISRWILIFDGDNYFDYDKINKLTNYRNEQDKGIEIVIIKKEKSKWIKKYYAQHAI